MTMKIKKFSRLTLFGRRHFFTIKGRNGEPMAQSEGYNNRSDRNHAITVLQRDLPVADIEEV